MEKLHWARTMACVRREGPTHSATANREAETGPGPAPHTLCPNKPPVGGPSPGSTGVTTLGVGTWSGSLGNEASLPLWLKASGPDTHVS